MEQTVRYLGYERPDLAAFQDWVVAVAGSPDPARPARYHATLAGDPPPATRDALAAIDSMPPVLEVDDLAGGTSTAAL